MRAGLARDAEAALRLAVELLELGPLDRPIDGDAEHRVQTQIFLGEAVARPAPVQRAAADRHAARDDAARGLIFYVGAGPRIFRVVDAAPPVLAAMLEI